MPAINPALVPTIAPGAIFSTFTTDTTLNIRWYQRNDPVHFETLNRPLADTVLRQLIMAKAIDTVNLSIGHQALFPFLVQPQIETGTSVVDVPPSWIWDLHMSAPSKWENFRLSKIKRVAGTNTGSIYTGRLRLIFTANQEGSSTEVAIFSANYEIDSVLTYQRLRLTLSTVAEEAISIDSSESETVDGFITFRTLDTTDASVSTFYEAAAPPVDTSDTDSDGEYDNPAIYETTDTVAGSAAVTGDFSFAALSHGSGLVVDSAENAIPAIDSDLLNWINAFNYPFDSSANLTSTGTFAIAIPSGLFNEFNITAPAGDEPSGDITGLFFPVWVSRIQITDTAGDTMRWFFATHNVTDDIPSLTAVEFATLDLSNTMAAGDIVEIIPLDDLRVESGDGNLHQQHFGRGHVVLSSLWGGTTTEVADFFNAFDPIPSSPVEADYSQSATRVSSFGISRVPKYIPTIGESQALKGTTSTLTTPIIPSSDNLYVTELDQGLGNHIDLEAQTGISSHIAIGRFGDTGSLAHRVVNLCIEQDQVPDDTTGSLFYDDEILPRLTVLLGRAPAFGDFWWNGTRLLFMNGDTWVG